MNRISPSTILAAAVAAAAVGHGSFASCPGDLDGSGLVDGNDLGLMLGAWGSVDPIADLDGNGLVDGADFGLLVAFWGPCPCSDDTDIDPLFDRTTPGEPNPLEWVGDALVTRFSDRARDRHAREGQFAAYDHYLPFYWEQRVAEIEIVDHVAAGGSEVVFRFMTHDRLNPAEFRTFYASGGAVYHNNLSDYINQGVELVDVRPSTEWPGETEYHYVATIDQKVPENRPLQVGDRMEVELSQFLLAPRNGRENYYGTAFLYVVGDGIVPWYAKAREEAGTPAEAEAASMDSFPLPEIARLGGRGTLPYQYSNEPAERFKQTAGNIAHASGHRFMLGRRLHHTDFATGAHSEDGNPIFAAQVGHVGPDFLNTSCVACHIGNGRSFPAALGQPIERSVVQVAADAQGAPHPELGDTLQPFGENAGGGEGGGGGGPSLLFVEAESFSAMSGVQTESCSDAGGGLNVGYIDPGDWMEYLSQPYLAKTPGNRRMELRVASDIGGGRIEIRRMGDPTLLGTVDIPNTGGWQSWVTLGVDLPMEAGVYRFRMDAPLGGWNLNWFRLVDTSDGGGGGDGGGEGEGPAMIASWEYTQGTYADGTPYELRRPILEFAGTTPEFHSLRNAMPLVGLGLLEAIDESTILELADPCDDDGDGISGRPRLVPDPSDPTKTRLGRFTAKAGRATIREQIARALNRDMGVTTSVFPILDGETEPEAPELDDDELDLMTRYTALLAVSARRNLLDEDALLGEALFESIGCTACHVPELVTGDFHPYGELRGQTIRPYTDLLLHDLGPGLADDVAEGDAGGSEWRTTPLWNIGLTDDVGGQKAFLHDGRARSLEEAILWHGGEAEASRESFRSLSAGERAAVIAFLDSL
ncbi:MAG: di-heme oxidoredictase family protein [Planctomycetota bacterium]|nr:di-heme oxidoredictase family protein [Planctomycetota bacterium]MEE2896223.1 di-heme oxidoredictase family protein [Planctomycetota bacterium]